MAAPVNIIVDSHVWVEDPDLAWIDGEVTRISGENVHVNIKNGKTLVTNMTRVFPKDSETSPGGVDDMTKLSYLHEPGVLQNLATRYELNEIYHVFKMEQEEHSKEKIDWCYIEFVDNRYD